MRFADFLISALVEAKAPDSVEVTDWRFELFESVQSRGGMSGGRIGEPYNPLARIGRAGGQIAVIWSDGRVTTANVDDSWRLPISELFGRLRASAVEGVARPYIAKPAPVPDVVVHDPAVAAVARGGVSALVGYLRRASASLHGVDQRDAVALVSASEGSRRVASSRGFDVAYRETSFSFDVSVGDLYGEIIAKRRVPTDDEIDGMFARMNANLSALRQPAIAPSGRIPVLFAPSVVDSLIARFVLPNLSWRAINAGRSAFSEAELAREQPIMRPGDDLVIDTTLPLELASSPCSAQGVPGGRVELVRDGWFCSPVVGARSSAIAGLAPTPVARSGSGATVLPPARGLDLEAVVRAVERGLFVQFVMGLHTQDRRSGRYALVSPTSRSIDRGTVGGRAPARVAGNFLQQIRDNESVWVRFPYSRNPGLLTSCLVRPHGYSG